MYAWSQFCWALFNLSKSLSYNNSSFKQRKSKRDMLSNFFYHTTGYMITTNLFRTIECLLIKNSHGEATTNSSQSSQLKRRQSITWAFLPYIFMYTSVATPSHDHFFALDELRLTYVRGLTLFRLSTEALPCILNRGDALSCLCGCSVEGRAHPREPCPFCQLLLSPTPAGQQ